jgi:hypothetical protein
MSPDGGKRIWLTNIRPLAGLGAGEDRIADLLRFQGVAERGARRLASREPFEKIGDLMDEGVFVTDLQTRHPPLIHVRNRSIHVGTSIGGEITEPPNLRS